MDIFRNIGGFSSGPYNVNGVSSPFGFSLVITDAETHTRTVFQTRGTDSSNSALVSYLTGEHENLVQLGTAITGVVTLIIIPGYIVAYGSVPSSWIEGLRMLIPLWCAWLAPREAQYVANYALSLLLMRVRPNLAQWHGCEHKAAELIERQLSLTYENLKAQPAVNIRCGSVQGYAVALQFSLCRWLILALLSALILGWAPYWVGIFILPCYYLLQRCRMYYRESEGTINGDVMRRYPSVFALPILFERLFAVAEPTDEMLRTVFEDLQNPHYYRESVVSLIALDVP